MNKFGFQKMYEKEQQITLRASRAAWIFLVIALCIWGLWELARGGGTDLPGFLVVAQLVVFHLAKWIGRAKVGDGRVKREIALWIVFTAALVLFGVLLVLGA